MSTHHSAPRTGTWETAPTGKTHSLRSRPLQRKHQSRRVSRDTDTLRLLLENPRRPKKAAGKDVKVLYRSTLMFGFVASLSLLLALTTMDLRFSNDLSISDIRQQETVQFEEIIQTTQELKAPPPPRPPIPVVVPDDVIFEDQDLDLDMTLDLDAAVLELPSAPPAPANRAEAVDEMEVFVVVEKMPEIIGGNKQIYENLEYPEIARRAGLEGLVVIQVIVDLDGTPREPVAARSGGEVLDEAAIRAVMQLRFIPGKQRGKAVRVRMAIPIRFRLRQAQPN